MYLYYWFCLDNDGNNETTEACNYTYIHDIKNFNLLKSVLLFGDITNFNLF